MRLTEYTRRLLSLAETVHRWLASLAALDHGSRDRIARYADEVAATLERAASALGRLHVTPDDPTLRLEALRELGRIAGYVETMVGVLQHHLDGRKLAGVIRRLELLAPDALSFETVPGLDRRLLGRIVVAGGYFRALADGLRA